MSESRYAHALPLGTILDGYRLIDVLGAGGFGITYLAEETGIGRRVAIKEFLPTDLATRRRDGTTVTPLDSSRAESFAFGLERFQAEARTLVAFEHPNIVSVYKYFEANGTAYYAMRYAEGEPLDRLLGRVGTLGEEDLLKILHPLVDGLEEVHAAGFLHRDIKPANIFIRRNRQPMLIDFGAARMALGDHSKSLTAILSPGFAPFEQYHGRGNQGPWTDIYALAATMYRCIAARTPPEATLRIDAAVGRKPDPMVPAVEAGRAWYSPVLLRAIDRALAVNESERPQSVAELRALLPERVAPVSPRTGPPSRPSRSGESSDGAATWLEKTAPAAEPAQPPTVYPGQPSPAPPLPVAPPAPQAPQRPLPVSAEAGRTQAIAAESLPAAPSPPRAEPLLRRRSTRIAAAILGAAIGAAAATYGVLRWTATPSQTAEEPRLQGTPIAGRDQSNTKEAPPPKAKPDTPTPPVKRSQASEPGPTPPPEQSQEPSERPATPEAVKRARLLSTPPDQIWSHVYGPGDLRSAALLQNGQIAVANSIPNEKKDERDTALAWIRPGGVRLAGRRWLNDDNNDVSRLLALPDGLVFAGSAKRKGSAFLDAWIVRVTAAGRQAWQEYFPEQKNEHLDEAFDLAAIAGGNFVFVGQSGRADPHGDGWAVFLDANGRRIGDDLLVGERGRIEELRRLAVLADGTFMAAGTVADAPMRWRFWLVRFDRERRVLLDKVFTDGVRSRPTDIRPVGDGVIVAGWTQAAEGRGAAAVRWLRMINAKGGIEWEAPILGEGAERIWRVLALDDGGYLLLLSRFRPDQGQPHIVRVDQRGRARLSRLRQGPRDP
jgi:serine/threonine protein kinase